MRRLLGLMALILGTAVAQGEELRWEVELDTGVSEAWAAFTTEEGMRAWIAPQVQVDFRIGGLIRSNYDPEAATDDPSWIETRVLAYEPERVLCWKTAKSPAGFAHAAVVEQAWSVIRFEPIGPERTRVVLTSCGWGEGPQWDAALEFFNRGNAYLLEKLEAHFAAESVADPLDILKRMVGGEWIHDTTRGGQRFRVLNTLREGPGGASIVMYGEQLIDGEMRPYSSSLAWQDPTDNACRFVSVKHDGSVARGTIRALDSQTIEWDWQAVSVSGEQVPYVIEMSMTEDHAYDMTMGLRQQGGGVRTLGPVIDFARESD